MTSALFPLKVREDLLYRYYLWLTRPPGRRIWITYIRAYMPNESSADSSNQPDGPVGSPRTYQMLLLILWDTFDPPLTLWDPEGPLKPWDPAGLPVDPRDHLGLLLTPLDPVGLTLDPFGKIEEKN